MRFQERQIEKPHWIHRLVAALLLPKFVTEIAATVDELRKQGSHVAQTDTAVTL